MLNLYNYDEILADYIKYAEALKPYVTDTNIAVLKAGARG